MKHLLHKFMLPVAALFIGLASCQPEETPTPTPTPPTPTTPTTPPPPQPTVSNVNGALIAVKVDFSFTQSGMTVPYNTEMGIAAFYNGTGNTTLVDGGTVKLNNATLTNTSNSYAVTAGIPTQEPASLNLDGDIHWEVSGNSGNNVSVINETLPAGFPAYSAASSIPTDVTKANGMVLSFTSGNTSNADSIVIVLVSNGVQVTKTCAANAGNVNITASELSGLPVSSTTNTVYIQIAAWKLVYGAPKTISGRQYAFINETVYMRSINLN